MAQRRLLMALVATVALFAADVANADCGTELGNLYPCVGFLNNGTAPKDDCCKPLNTTLIMDPVCLCTVLEDINYNRTQVLALPPACKLITPPLSLCAPPPVSAPPPESAGMGIAPSMLLSFLAVAALSTKIFL